MVGLALTEHRAIPLGQKFAHILGAQIAVAGGAARRTLDLLSKVGEIRAVLDLLQETLSLLLARRPKYS